MESFFRYIAYIDYYEKGLRIHNAGYLRWKMAGGKHLLEIEVKEADLETGYFSVNEEETGEQLASIQLEKGQGGIKESFVSVEKEGRLFLMLPAGELPLHRVRALRIDLGRERVLRIPVELPLPQIPQEQKNSWKKKKDSLQTAKPSEGEEVRKIEEKKAEESKRPREKKSIIEAAEPEKKNQEEYTEVQERREEKVHPPLEEDKWQQLCKSYPQVHPFPGGRTFLTIKPEDFVLLQEKYQKLVHNSFLLHGYYNYRHMILGKLEDREESPYYIGVPGVFYEKEKQAAGLFGFAGFEGTEYPVRNGSYGYYMIEVKL